MEAERGGSLGPCAGGANGIKADIDNETKHLQLDCLAGAVRSPIQAHWSSSKHQASLGRGNTPHATATNYKYNDQSIV